MKVGFFEDSDGVKSSTRMIFVFGSFWNILLSTYFAFKGVEPTAILAFFAGIEGTLTGLKLGQKYIEKKQIK